MLGGAVGYRYSRGGKGENGQVWIGSLMDWRGDAEGVEAKKKKKEEEVGRWGWGGNSMSNMIDNSTLFFPLFRHIIN